MDSQGIVWLMFGVLFVWSLWLATCRPDAYNKLTDGVLHRAERAGSVLFKIIRIGAGKYARHRRGW